ncbi:hypothetical protein [Saccharothrix sp. NRRL B-16348]|uniref:PIN-like domain-containing protein n=1 Tax=Saccharothrix sp. NRRL B-16348 TaxID=1415542 RepID=UPI0006AE1233|nr:hypothetical protein [Saccharothrix sp. NRRL B-16348]
MKFFIDENLPPRLTDPLDVIFRGHEFRSCLHEGLSGTLDIPLFEILRTREFGAIITKDTGQVGRNDDERRALHERGIHWIGVKEPSARGLQLVTAWVASITAAMPHILEKVEQADCQPSWFGVKGITHQSAQRMDSGELWRPRWGARPAA